MCVKFRRVSISLNIVFQNRIGLTIFKKVLEQDNEDQDFDDDFEICEVMSIMTDQLQEKKFY